MTFLLELTQYLSEQSEYLIRNICKDLGKEEYTEKLINKYLKTEKIYKKKTSNVKNKRKKTSYSMFLKYNTIRKDHTKMTLEEYNIYKGEYWKNISSEEKNKYQKLADSWNEEYKNNKIKKEEKIDIRYIKKEKTNDVDILDCFFDDEYLENKKVEKKIEEI